MYNKYPALFIAFLSQAFFSSIMDRMTEGTGSSNTAGAWSRSGMPVGGNNITIYSNPGFFLLMLAGLKLHPGQCSLEVPVRFRYKSFRGPLTFIKH